MSSAEQQLQPHTQREVELKFRVHGLFRLPDLHTVAGVADVDELGSVELQSAYFDTPDLRLAREGITLRRRTGDDDGWQLKVPVDPAHPGVRDEIRLPLTTITPDAPPETLLRIVRAVVRRSPVSLVATLRTERTAQVIKNGKGRPVAELIDDTVHVVAPDGTVTARFRELELEERKGGAAMSRVAHALASAGAVSGEFVAKLVRALGPAAAAAPEVPPSPQVRLTDPAGDAAAAYIGTQIRALRAADIAFRSNAALHQTTDSDDDATPDDHGADEAVHLMRVATRRLRGALRTFRPLFDSGWAKHLRGELSWFTQGLNDLRENDVLRSRLAAHVADLPDDVPGEPVRKVLDAEFARALDTARESAMRMLDSDRYLALHERLVGAANDPPLTERAAASARDVLPGLVRDSWQRLAKDADHLTQDSPAEQWHALRLRAKQARYAAEAVAVVVGAEAAAFARQMERLTDLLGEHQDASQAGDRLHRLAEQVTDTDVVFALGALAASEHNRALAARRRFPTIWQQARRPKWRRWLKTP